MQKHVLEKIDTFGKLTVYAICGHRYPTGSIKYRVAERLIAEAEQSGLGKGIVEVSSGNTGQALAFLGREKGYPVTIICPKDVTPAAKARIRSYGAALQEVDGWYAPCHQYAEKMEQAGWFWPRQVENPATLRVNEELGTQIASSLNVDYFLASVGTGATFTGIARSLKRVQSTKAYLVLPEGEYTVPGVDDPTESTVQLPLFDRSLVDGDIRVSQQEAVAAAKELRALGYPVGISAGANVAASKKMAGSGAQGNALIVFADSSDRYPELLGNI